MPVNHVIDYDCETNKIGRFSFMADGPVVIVSKDSRGLLITIGSYTYKDHEQACDMAWRMACKQARA